MFVCPSLRWTLSRKWFESKNKAKQNRQTDRPGHTCNACRAISHSKWRRGQKRAWHSLSSWILKKIEHSALSSTCALLKRKPTADQYGFQLHGKVSKYTKEDYFVLTGYRRQHEDIGYEVDKWPARRFGNFPWEMLILQKLERKMVWKLSRTCSVINSS